MDNIDDFLNYIDETLESMIQGHSSHAETDEPELPVARQIKHKLEKLERNLSEIHGLVRRLNRNGLRRKLSGEGGEHTTRLKSLLSAVEEHVSELERTSETDEMTGLMNRQKGVQAVERRFAEDISDEGLCLVFIDVDNLKQVNDSFGHGEGDLYIKRVAETILTSMRRTDIAVRYGGDEFLLLFPGCGKVEAEKKMHTMRDELGRLSTSFARPYLTSFSYGIASNKENPSLSVWDLIYLADRRMYAQKRHRREQLENLRLEYIG